jgi:hypothetical protein
LSVISHQSSVVSYGGRIADGGLLFLVATQGENVRVRIGIGDTSREIELDVADADALIVEIEEAFDQAKAILWFTDVGDRRIGVPITRIAYVEVEPDQRVSVGFTAS